MAAAELVMAGVGQGQTAGTKGINDYIEAPGNPQIEVFRVTSDADGDYFFSRKFIKIKAPLVQNHGATLNTGSRDQPKIVVQQGDEATSTPAKITINHTATEEVFSFIIIGDM